jgi:hypothetical protein
MPAKMPASYYGAYRIRNRERLNAQERARKAAQRLADPEAVRLVSRCERERARTRRLQAAPAQAPPAAPAVPRPYDGHYLLRYAWEIAKRTGAQDWRGEHVYDPLREDAAGVALLAMLEGVDPTTAVKRFLTDERAWRWRHLPLLME